MQVPLFKDFGKVIVRTPLYSYQRLFGLQGKTLDLEDVTSIMLDDPVFLEGLYWSSPQLYQTVQEFRQGHLKDHRKNKLMHTLKKYAIRASTRCTPYGTYAGCAVANIGDEENRRKQVSARKVRMDMGILQQMIKKMESDPVLWSHLHYRVNNSLYTISGQYRFIESVHEDGKCQYQISSIDRTDLIAEVITLAQTRNAVTIDDIYSLMDKETCYDEVALFVKGLIDSQLLVSELQLGLTIENELERIGKILEGLVKNGITEADTYLSLLGHCINILQEFDRLPLGILPLKEINELKQLLIASGIASEDCHIFHADLKTPIPSSFVFSRVRTEELEDAIRILSKLTPNTSPNEIQLDRFKKKFIEKYETQEIPLAEALDPEFGIGFPSTDNIGNVAHNSLAEEMNLTGKKTANKKANECHIWLKDKVEALDIVALEEGICLQDKDLEKYEDKLDQLASHFTVMGTQLPSGKILLQTVGGAHSNMLLGRFAHLEKEISDLCTELAEAEAQGNDQVIFAEVVHIPEGRVGNIARRLKLSSHEIPFLASSAADADKQLPVEDIMLSVQQNEIILRSTKWNKRIIPRLSNAHNYFNSTISVYKFLSAIQHQGKQGFEISWGTGVQDKRFLPRISYKSFILHRATWFLQENDIQSILRNENPLYQLKSYFSKWRVPRFVCFCEGDKELFIDTHNDTYLQMLLEEIRLDSTIKLVEWLDNDVAADGTKRQQPFVHQFILPLAKTRPVKIRPFGKEDDNSLQRIFEPGSEWVYYKIYCGAKVSDSVLLKGVKPAIDLLLDEGVISRAFFIRYTEPHYHIRFRMHLADRTNAAQFPVATRHVYNILHPFLSDRTVWKVQLDTYQREIERYGKGSMLTTEETFFHDSLLFLTCIEDETFEEDQHIRFLTAVKNMDNWLSLFNMSLPERIAFCNDMSGAFGLEFGRDIKRQLDQQYRDWKKPIAQFLNDDKFNSAFEKRENKLKELVLPIENISSYIHMSMNRWFATEQRLMEYMAYHFCGKYYNQIVHQTNGSQ